jgi:hypothetical protein
MIGNRRMRQASRTAGSAFQRRSSVAERILIRSNGMNSVLRIHARTSGPSYWPICGRVTFQGKPIAAGQIRFCDPKSGVDVVQPFETDGRYVIITGKLEGLPEGRYQVAIMPKLDFSKVKCDKNGLPISSTMPSAAERHPANIPQKYHDPGTSGLTVTVKPESNTFDVDMQPAR